VRSLHAEHGECHTTLLTSRQSSDLLETCQTRDPERSKMRSIVLLHLARELVLQEPNGCHSNVELINMMLGEVCDPASVVMCRPSHTCLDITGEKLDQSRFSRSVRPNHSDSTVQADIDIDST